MNAIAHHPLRGAALALAIGLAAGCAGLPDQRLADEAMARGDIATAQANYQALATLGYTDAQIGLADMQAATLALYRELARG